MAEQLEPSSNGSKLLRTLGVESTMRIDPWWGLVVLVVALIVVLCLVSTDPFWNILRFVSDGILITVTITVSSFVLVLVLGLFGGLGRLSRNRLIYGLATVYVEIVRGIPLLVQLIWWITKNTQVNRFRRQWGYSINLFKKPRYRFAMIVSRYILIRRKWRKQERQEKQRERNETQRIC